jgi:hypothetical protein
MQEWGRPERKQGQKKKCGEMPAEPALALHRAVFNDTRKIPLE